MLANYGWCGFVPRTAGELDQARREQQYDLEDRYHAIERSHFGTADEAAENIDSWNGGLGKIDLGGIMAQPIGDLH